MKIYQIISFCILIFQIQAQTQANNVTNNDEMKYFIQHKFSIIIK